ncbi:hypothetical protein GP5015_1272 [gamma proteobacterium HTCC5015]|nr:hypothetical protein GP5015_1272 [gamma proteobacterium HTCC5015]
MFYRKKIMKTSLLSLSSLLILSSAFALSACGGGGGSDDDSAIVDGNNTDGEIGRHVRLRYNYNVVESYELVNFQASAADVQVAANCSELRWVEDNDGEIYSEDTAQGTASVTVSNGEVDVSTTGTTELSTASFGHCPQGVPGNGTSFSSDIRCYDDNEILYLKAEQDNYADGEAACTDGVGGSLEA